MRNAQQLRAAAIATGWFDGPNLNYVGDGFTIPWQSGNPVGGALFPNMALWKAYLDTRFLEFSRLHDWLYTPYGPQLINATQEEADQALRAEVSAIDPVSGEIVYQACSLGGAPYFGVSTVGYVQPALKPSGDNMATISTRVPLTANDFKIVMVMQQRTEGTAKSAKIGYTPTPRMGGWTESFWITGSTFAQVLVMLKGPRTTPVAAPPILEARATCLSLHASVLGARVYQGGTGKGQFVSAVYPGTTWRGDQPGTSLLCQTVTPEAVTVRRFTMRGIPDTQCVDGEFLPTPEFTTQVYTYFESLQGTSFLGKLPSTVYEVFTIDAEGRVTLRVPSPFKAGDIVTISNAVDVNGNRRGGEFSIVAPGPDVSQFLLKNWLFGACRGGSCTIPVKGFVKIAVGQTSAVRITNHKIGRPFAGYRGRKSKRRKQVPVMPPAL
jgi:hypothetical protein